MSITELPVRLRQIRDILHFSQGGVALAMGVTQQSYAQVEASAHTAKIQTLNKACQAMGIDISFLISNTPITRETVIQNLSNPLIIKSHV